MCTLRRRWMLSETGRPIVPPHGRSASVHTWTTTVSGSRAITSGSSRTSNATAASRAHVEITNTQT